MLVGTEYVKLTYNFLTLNFIKTFFQGVKPAYNYNSNRCLVPQVLYIKIKFKFSGSPFTVKALTLWELYL